MRRRALLLAAATLPTVPGCSALDAGSSGSPGGGGPDTPGDASSDALEYDCSRASRPEPSASDSADAVQPATYPDPPSTPGNDDQTVAFVEGFETAYQRNRLVERWGAEMTGFGFDTAETWTVDSTGNAAVAGVEYTFHYTTESNGNVSVADSPYQTTVYYVDASVALRAHREGSRTSGDVPDPREDGEEVVCFE